MSRPDAQPSSQPVAGDRFGAVLGQGRGLTDPVKTAVELQECKDALASAQAELTAARMREDTMQDVLARLTDQLAETEAARAQAVLRLNEANAWETELCHARDRARYAAMRSGQRDPVPGPIPLRVHQGVWTPGRPYLCNEHAFHPSTGDCYRTDRSGAPVGELPGTGRHWEACMDKQTCPVLRPVPTSVGHPLEVLRQAELWWDPDRTTWHINEMTDRHLAQIITSLRSRATVLYSEDASWSIPAVPCPWNAYPSPSAWLADTPLMLALLRERRRRRDTARRQTSRQKAQS